MKLFNLDKLPKRIAGRTYAEKKENARQLAIDTQDEISRTAQDWLTIATLGAYFEDIGRQYGLLREFRENAIC